MDIEGPVDRFAVLAVAYDVNARFGLKPHASATESVSEWDFLGSDYNTFAKTKIARKT